MAEQQSNPVYLSSFFSVEDIHVFNEEMSLRSLIRHLVGATIQTHQLALPELDVVDAVLRRERVASTIIGNGLALPHTRLTGLERPYLTVGVFPKGVRFAEDELPVTVAFLLLIPESQPARYLQILRALTKMVREEDSVRTVSKMSDPEEIMAFFRRGELMLPSYICAADLMVEKFNLLNESEPLANAFDFFMEKGEIEIPVVSREGDMLGVVDVRSMLGKFIPTGFKRFAQLPPTPTLEPLAAILKHCKTTSVGEVINNEFISVQVETPAREIAIAMAESNAFNCYVLKKQELVGVIPVGRFFGRILKD